MQAGPDPSLVILSRVGAAQKLAERLQEVRRSNLIVLAIPPGGVPLGFELSRLLGAEFDIIIAIKVSVPENPQRALGAVAEWGGYITSDRRLAQTEHLEVDLKSESDRAAREVARRAKFYRQERTLPDLTGHTVIVVADGVVEPLIVRAALRGVGSQSPQRVIFATGVLPRYCMVEIRKDVPEVVALREPQVLFSVAEWYRDLPPVTDAEIQQTLRDSVPKFPRRAVTGPAPLGSS